MNTSMPWGVAVCLLLWNSSASAQQTTPSKPESAEVHCEPLDSIEPIEMDQVQPAASASELELLAVDIARRAVLITRPQAGKAPILTVELVVRPAGDEVHTYARLQWTANQKKSDTQWYTSEVSAKLIYTPGLRRVHEISYEDNYWVPYRNTIHVDLVSKINDQFDLRDGVLAPVQQMILDPRPDRLPPRTPAWRFNPFAGDRPWHVSIADDRIRPTNVPKR